MFVCVVCSDTHAVSFSCYDHSSKLTSCSLDIVKSCACVPFTTTLDLRQLLQKLHQGVVVPAWYPFGHLVVTTKPVRLSVVMCLQLNIAQSI